MLNVKTALQFPGKPFFHLLFLKPLHEFVQALQSIDVAIADLIVLADIVAALDEIVLAGTFRFGGEHADFAVAVAD